MRLANEEPELHRLGAEIVAVSVDPPERNAALRQRWHLPFPIVSDPAGEELLVALEAWNPDERGGIAWPLVLLVAPDGREVLRVRSRDFADRPTDDDLIAALAALDLSAIHLEPAADAVPPVEDPGALRTDAFGPYFRGVRFSTIGLSGRMIDSVDRDEVVAMSDMAGSFLEAWKQRRADTE